MEVKAITKYVRISAFKARNMTRHIQGMPVNDAMDLLRFSPQKAARLVGKTLKTAVANAENNNALDPDLLMVKEAVVGEGPTIKRFRPRARGGAGSIRKRTSHIRIILTEREEKQEDKKKTVAKKSASKAGKKTAAKKAAKKTVKKAAAKKAAQSENKE
ncbi:MAG: 50S ribosomal protein L22, partial [Verrucomicrobiota bacterium]